MKNILKVILLTAFISVSAQAGPKITAIQVNPNNDVLLVITSDTPWTLYFSSNLFGWFRGFSSEPMEYGAIQIVLLKETSYQTTLTRSFYYVMERPWGTPPISTQNYYPEYFELLGEATWYPY